MPSLLIENLARACREHLLAEKWLISPSRRVAHQWLDQVTRAGGPAVNVRVVTTRSVAVDLLAAAPEGADHRIASPAARRIAVAAAWQATLGGGGGYLASARMTPRLLALVERTIVELRLAGLKAAAIDVAAFEPRRKGLELQMLLGEYEARLEELGLIDHADAIRMATGLAASHVGAVLLRPMDIELSGLERAFLDAFSAQQVVHLPVDQPAAAQEPGAAPETDIDRLRWILRPAEAPAPASDGTARIVHAVGEINEVREALRSCAAQEVALDQVEIICTDTGTYVPLVYETALRVLGSDPNYELGVPVTFAEGLPARLTRPGRLLAAWLSWISGEYPQHTLVRMLQDGLLGLPRDEAGKIVSSARLVAALRRASIVFDRDRYMPRLDEAIQSLARRVEGAGGAHDEEPDPARVQRLQRRLDDTRRLRALVAALLDASPLPSDAPRLVPAALVLIRDHAWCSSPLDRLARTHLVQELTGMSDALAAAGPDIPRGFDPWQWLAELPDRLRVAGSSPRPGHLHLSDLSGGGHSGRAHTFVVGMDDTRFPPSGLQDPLLLDRERHSVSGALTQSSQRVKRRIDAFARLVSRLEGHLTLSFSSRALADGRSTFASPQVLSAYRILSGRHDADHTEMMEGLAEPASFAPGESNRCLDEADWWLACGSDDPQIENLPQLVSASFPHLAAGAFAASRRGSDAFTVYDGLIEDPGPQLDPRHDQGPILSASRLQQLGACPLSYWYRYVLHIEPPDDAEVEPGQWLDALQFGSLMHEVLYDFVCDLIGRGVWPPDRSRDRATMQRAVEQRLGEWEWEIPPPGREALGRQRRELERAAQIFITEQARRERGGPLYLEAAVGMAPTGSGTDLDQAEPVRLRLPGGGEVRVRARLDRIDRIGRDDTFAVCDYKSGRSTRQYEGSDSFRQGRLLQHVLYMAVAEAVLRKRFGPAATVRGFEFFFPSQRIRGRSLPFDRAIVEEGLRIVETMCRLVAGGAFPATDGLAGNRPVDCEHCDYRRACRAVQRDLRVLCNSSREKIDAAPADGPLGPFVELRRGG